MTRSLALAGNPNSGKTSLFNRMTGSSGRVGNYPGVTVERREGRLRLPGGEEVRLVDVPGCYSLTARSQDEVVAHDAILGPPGGAPVDLVVVVVDATNLARNLYLALQLAELGRPLVIALNMMDVARTEGLEIDLDCLQRRLGVAVVPTVATRGEGVEALVAAIEEALNGGERPQQLPPLGPEDGAALAEAQAILRTAGLQASAGHALWLLTSSARSIDRLPPVVAEGLQGVRERATPPIAGAGAADLNRRIIMARYAQIDSVVRACVPGARDRLLASDRTEQLDRVLTHPVLGWVIFVSTMFVVFQAVFSWAVPVMDLMEAGMAGLGAAVNAHLPAGVLTELLVEGVIAGIGNILVFVPQIVLLFLAIAFLEDTGYMARAAYLLDRLMRRVGLHGRAFVPLLSSFACAVPGIMATRTIETSRDRLVTILVAPLMSCSARLPVYTMVIAAVFSGAAPVLGVLSVGGLVVAAMYFLGIVAALSMAAIFKRTLLRSPSPPLVMEMPGYRRPSLRSVLLTVYRRLRVFLVETGRVILALTVILWALMTYPRTPVDPAAQAARVAELNVTLGDGARAEAGREAAQRSLENSIAGRMGRAIEPAIAPLGFDWRIGIGLIGSFAAREVLVSTLGQVYGVGADVDPESVVLSRALKDASGFTPLVGLSLMVFFVLAMQCLATVATVRRETNSWRWPLFMIVYMNALAWLGAFATYQVGQALGYA